MPNASRSRSTVVVLLAGVPILVAAYAAFFVRRGASSLRAPATVLLGATVIWSVYAETGARKAARPEPTLAVLALALALVAPAITPAPVAAASSPREAVIAAALRYVGHPFRLGSEGPRYFDCSGFVYRAFADAGQLWRIGGKRLLARGYTSLFHERGRYALSEGRAERGDLISYTNGGRIAHIGIYLGSGKIVSALVNPWGVKITRINGINMKFSHVLKVNWSDGRGDRPTTNGDDPPAGNNDGSEGDNATPDPPSSDIGDTLPNGVHPDRPTAIATGTINLRIAADPAARVLGWISRGSTLQVLAHGRSPAGYLWYRVETAAGRVGWIYSALVRELKN